MIHLKLRPSAYATDILLMSWGWNEHFYKVVLVAMLRKIQKRRPYKMCAQFPSGFPGCLEVIFPSRRDWKNESVCVDAIMIPPTHSFDRQQGMLPLLRQNSCWQAFFFFWSKLVSNQPFQKQLEPSCSEVCLPCMIKQQHYFLLLWNKRIHTTCSATKINLLRNWKVTSLPRRGINGCAPVLWKEKFASAGTGCLQGKTSWISCYLASTLELVLHCMLSLKYLWEERLGINLKSQIWFSHHLDLHSYTFHCFNQSYVLNGIDSNF